MELIDKVYVDMYDTMRVSNELIQKLRDILTSIKDNNGFIEMSKKLLIQDLAILNILIYEVVEVVHNSNDKLRILLNSTLSDVSLKIKKCYAVHTDINTILKMSEGIKKFITNKIISVDNPMGKCIADTDIYFINNNLKKINDIFIAMDNDLLIKKSLVVELYENIMYSKDNDKDEILILKHMFQLNK